MGAPRCLGGSVHPPRPNPHRLVAGPTGLCGGPAAELASATAAWQPLWLRPDVPAQGEAAWFAALAALPPFPDLPPLSAEAVGAALASAPLGRAPGCDDWCGEELRLWPASLHPFLASLFSLVEATGLWPGRLAGAEVVLLPKPGGEPGDPLQRRPIALLPVLYRTWARLRGATVAAWSRAWDPAAAAASLGADGQAWELTWTVAWAAATGRHVAGLAVDFRKCYDGVRLPLLERALATAGWPPGLCRPLLAAYAAPRRLRVAGALGEPWLPASGVPAGCPLAVAVLAVLTWPWAVRVGQPPVSARRYVDDLTAWAVGPPGDVAHAAADALAVTRDFAAAVQFDVHPGKTFLFGSSLAVRTACEALGGGVAAVAVFRDLGVVQVVGRTPPPVAVAAARAAGAEGRFARLEALPLAYPARVRAVAAAGVAAAAWGALAGRPPAAALRRMRALAGRAVWRGGRFGAAELRLLLGDPAGRADPAAQVAVAPLFMLARALRSGHVTATAVREVQGALARSALGRALARSLRDLRLRPDLLFWAAAPHGPACEPWSPQGGSPSPRRSFGFGLGGGRSPSAAVAARRPGFGGAAAGIDWGLASTGLRSTRLTPAQRGALVRGHGGRCGYGHTCQPLDRGEPHSAPTALAPTRPSSTGSGSAQPGLDRGA